MAFLRQLTRHKYRLVMFGVMSCVFSGAAFQTWHFGKETLAWKPIEGRVTRREGGHRGVRYRIHIEYVPGHRTYHLVVEDELVLKGVVTVYYDPSQPRDAVVTPGVNLVKFMAFGLLACVGVFGVLAHFALALWPQLESEESKYEGDLCL